MTYSDERDELMQHDSLTAQERKQWEAIGGLEKSQERVVAVLDGMMSRLESIEKKVTDASKPQWQALSFVLGVTVFIYGIISFGINSKIDSVMNMTENTRETLAGHMDGHPQRVESKIEANKSSLVDLLEQQRRETDRTDSYVKHELDRVRDRLEKLEDEKRHAPR